MAIKHGFNLHVVLKYYIITLMFMRGSRSTNTQRVNDHSTNCENCHSNNLCMLCFVFTRIINTHGHIYIYEVVIYVCIYILSIHSCLNCLHKKIQSYYLGAKNSKYFRMKHS